MLLRRPSLWLLAVIIWFGTLWFLSSRAMLTPPGPQFANQDKFYHALYFTIGGTFMYLFLRFRSPSASALAISFAVIMFCSAAGAIDEFHQSFVPNRSGNDLGDWLADTAGGIIASFTGLYAYRRLTRSAATVETSV